MSARRFVSAVVALLAAIDEHFVMATRLELLQRCVTVAANETMEAKGLDGWTLTIRSGERSLTVDFYQDETEREWTCTFPTAGWDGTIEEIAERFRKEVTPDH